MHDPRKLVKPVSHDKHAVNIQRICVKAKPSAHNPEYYDWQTASICMFVPEDDKPLALEKARRELTRLHWVFVAYEDKSTLIEEKVSEAGGEVWDAFQYARQGKIFFRVFPDHFGAADKSFRPILPARVTEAFMDRVFVDAGGRRLRETEKQSGVRNADYLIGRFVFELKDLQEEGLEKGSRQEKLAKLFCKYYPGQSEIFIDPSVLSKPDYLKYLEIISTPIKTHIRSASKQVKATKNLLKRNDLFGGIALLNTGFGSFPHEAFAEQVERYAAKDSKQFEAVISISAWTYTNGFDSFMYYRFSPTDAKHEEVLAIKKAFDKRFEQMMTDILTGKLPDSAEKSSPAKPVTFEHSGIDFAWVPPRVPLPWES